MGKKENKKKWWHEGIQFECQGSGKCCTSHGEYGYVYFTKKDRIRAAKVLGITEKQFREDYCRNVDNAWALKEPESGGSDCIFLKEKRCSMYEGRPTQCRTWPFWPSVMHAKTWNKAVANFCPGVGKGRIWTAEEINQNLIDEMANEGLLQVEMTKNK